MKRNTKSMLAICLTASLMPLRPISAWADPPTVTRTVQNNVVFAPPVSVAWAKAYPNAAANLAATNADGWSNLQKMLAQLPPDDQSLHAPLPPNAPTVVGFPRPDAKHLRTQAATARSASVPSQPLELRAAAAEAPMILELGNGKIASLVDVDDEGRPTYVQAQDIYSAAGTRADQLWPTNSVTAVSGWISGRTGLNLTGTNQLVDMWEADYTSGSAGVQTGHDQFYDTGTGTSRVTQGDSTGVSPHATAVAGVLTSAGKDEIFNLGPSTPNVNLGNYSRGIAFGGTVNAWSLNNFQINYENEAGNGLALANNSWGQSAGWATDGTNWYWYGGSNTNLTDWQFGAYVGSYGGGYAPRQLDSMSYLYTPNTLAVFSAGDYQGGGPGTAVTYYLSTDPTRLHPQTAAKNWLNGDAGGYRTVTPSQSAKDVLTVGGVYAITPGYVSPTNVILAPFSSMGPTTDGRIKPEVVAPALVNPTVTSYNPLGFPAFITPYYDPSNPTITDNYALSLGTSYSSPTVAGGLALVLEERINIQPTWTAFPLLSSTLRALAVATADQAGTNAGPSYKFGYGLFDAVNAVQLVAADAITATNVADGYKPYVKEVDLIPATAPYIQFNIYATNASTPLKVTLAWTDPQGATQTSGVANDPTPRLVNDLDLRIYPPGTTTFVPSASTTYKPWILNPDLTNLTVVARSAAATTGDDSRNNLEQVVVNSPLTGTNNPYIVRVTYKGSLKNNSGGAASDQWASLIMTGNLSTALPFSITGFYTQPNGQFIITWNAVVGGDYLIQGTTDFVHWTTIASNINANLETMSALITPSGSYMLYRIGRTY